MENETPVTTELIGTVTTAPDSDGWQVIYEIGVQGDQLVVMSITERSLIGIAPGGLTARRARDLIKPGEALRQFAEQAASGAARWPLSDAQVQAALRDGVAVEAARVDSTREYQDYLAWLRELPALSALTRGRGPVVNRRQRVAITAALYVRAIKAGEADPRKRVAEIQRRSDYAVRDDLHAARVERPQLLTRVRHGKSGGELTPAATEILKELR